MMRLQPILVTHKSELKPGQAFPVDGWKLEMPVNAEVAGFVVDPAGNLGAMVLMRPNVVKIAHPLLLMPVGGSFNPLVGRKIGKCFGIHVIPAGPVGVFQDAPWPTTTLLNS